MSTPLNPSLGLKVWHDVMLSIVLDEDPDLSARQLLILLTVYLERPPHTVRGLAAKLNVTKPVITRALDTMGSMDLLARRRDELDRRNVLVQRTVKGSLFVERLSDTLVRELQKLKEG
jgi:DNA-binding MarR family transcriptional regulator